MQNTLSEMWKKYNLLLSFKNEMNKLGYASKDLYSIEMQMEVLMELIQVESENVLESLLKKTYFRLLKKIISRLMSGLNLEKMGKNISLRLKS